jgi:hypothetical protein
MNVSQSRIVNPPESGTNSPPSRWQVRSGPSIALLICPATLLVCGLVLLGYMSPIYSGVGGMDYDPAYAYLFNGAALMHGHRPLHTDHPGTPVQLLIGLITIISWSLAKLSGLTSLSFAPSVAAHAENYLLVIMSCLLIAVTFSVWRLGVAIARSTGVTAAGVACQAGYFLLGVLFPRTFYSAPEAMVFLAGTALMTVLAPVIFADEDCSDRRAVAAGVFLGLGTASKVIFCPLFVLVLLLKRQRPILIAIGSGVLFTLIFLLPIIDRLRSLFNFLTVVAGHTGIYGEGEARFIDWTVIPERIRQTIAAEPLLLVAVIALAGVVLFAKSRDKWLAAVMAFAVGVAVFLTLKHFAIHYLMPVVAIVPVMIIWALSRFARRSYPYLLVAAVAAVLGIQPFLDTASTFAKARALHSENEKAIQEILAKYQNPVMIGAFRSGDRFFALQFGLGRADTKFQNLTPGILGDQLSYHSNLKKLWRNDTGTVVDWSYLDQFEKAGRAVLIVQPVHPKIEPKIVKTETLLDRGVGDSLERIIVSPKGTN